MSEHRVLLQWQAEAENSPKGRFRRDHTWSFDGGIQVPASASPQVIRPPKSSEAAVDPEEALVAALASCHLLSFLYVADQAGFRVLRYEDEAVGTLSRGESGVPWISRISLFPRHSFSADHAPSDEEIESLHQKAHATCYIAASIRSEVVIHWTREIGGHNEVRPLGD